MALSGVSAGQIVRDYQPHLTPHHAISIYLRRCHTGLVRLIVCQVLALPVGLDRVLASAEVAAELERRGIAKPLDRVRPVASQPLRPARKAPRAPSA